MSDGIIGKPNRAHVTLPSVEIPQIYRDPPKSIHTRRWEPIEEGDVQHHFRVCNDRFTDHISKFAHAETISHGQNRRDAGKEGSTIGDSRSNAGGNLYGQWGNPYKVNKAFRPPILRPTYDLLPLSRMPRPNTSVFAQAHFPYQTRIETMKTLDMQKIRQSVWSLPQPSETFVLGDHTQRSAVTSYIDQHHNTIAAQSAISPNLSLQPQVKLPHLKGQLIVPVKTAQGGNIYVNVVDNNLGTSRVKLKEKPVVSILSNISQVAIFDNTTRSYQYVDLPVQDKKNIAIQASANLPISLPVRDENVDGYIRENNLHAQVNSGIGTMAGLGKRQGTGLGNQTQDVLHTSVSAGFNPNSSHFNNRQAESIRLKDYRWFIHTRPDGGQVLVIDPHNRQLPVLQRNLPLVTGRSGEVFLGVDVMREIPRNFHLKDLTPISITAQPTYKFEGKSRKDQVDNSVSNGVKNRSNAYLQAGGFERMQGATPRRFDNQLHTSAGGMIEDRITSRFTPQQSQQFSERFQPTRQFRDNQSRYNPLSSRMKMKESYNRNDRREIYA